MSLLTSLNVHMSVNIITATSAVQNATVIYEELCLPPIKTIKSKTHTNLRNELAILCCGNSELVSLYSTCYIPTLSSCSTLKVDVRLKDRDSAVSLRLVCYNDQVPACVGSFQVATLVNDTMDRILGEMIQQTKKGSEFYQTLRSLEQEEKYQMIAEILGPYTGNMFVTPKEVDAVVDRLANIIANSINIALHPSVTMADINKYNF